MKASSSESADSPQSIVAEFLARGPIRPLRIALIRPPWVLLRESIGFLMPTPPVGLAYIAAALRADGHDVTVIDAPGEAMDYAEDLPFEGRTVRRIGLTPEQIVARIPDGTEFIGITNMFCQEWPTIREMAELCRQRFPDVVLVVGGENATSFWPWMFDQTDAIDCAVLGEGEQTARELAARVASGAGFSDLAGVAVSRRNDGGQVDNGLPVRLKDLESIPRPAWDLFPMENYFRYRAQTGVYRGRSIPILATRGCPYKCTFCSSPNMWTTRYATRDPLDVVDEIQEYVQRYQVRNLDFVDLTPITKRSWMLTFCDEMERRGLSVSLQLPIGTRSEALDQQVLDRMAAAGVTNITFAPESGSERLLEIYDKRVDLGRLLEGIKAARRAGMVTNIHMILGHPQETWRDRWQSWRFMMRAAIGGLHSAGTTLFFPYPGSKDFQDLLDGGRIVVDDAYCYDGLSRGGGAVNRWNDSISPRQLHLLQLWNVGTFTALSHLLNPGQIVHLVRNILLGGEERTWIEQGIRSKRRGVTSIKRRGFTTVSRAPTGGASRALHASHGGDAESQYDSSAVVADPTRTAG